jgi:methyl-accepting chemotaxis protein
LKPAENLRETKAMPKIDNQSLELALFALVALAMVVQALVLFAAFLAMRKAAQSMNEKLDDISTTVKPILTSMTPIIETSRNLITKLAPRIDATSEDVAAIAHSLRAQAVELQSAADEVVERARAQANRFDAMLSNAFDAMDRAGGFVADCINNPMRQFAALLASARAAIESFRTSVPTPRSQSNHAPGDGDMFV